MRSLKGEIHVYHLNMADFLDDSISRFWPLLVGDERERALRIRHIQTQRSFVLVRCGLRVLLGNYLSCDPQALRFIQGEKGKPRLAGTEPDRGLVFNVSHSGNYGLIAIALDTALGVDVEKWRAMSDMEGIAVRCFSDVEQVYWQGLHADYRQQAFFSFWCFKEAFVKATGQGITLGLESCEVELLRQPRLISIPPGFGSPNEWQLARIDGLAGHSAGVCYHGSERRLYTGDSIALVNTLFNLTI